MDIKRNARATLADVNTGKQNTLRRYHIKLHNAISKGTAFGAVLASFMGAFMAEGEAPGGFVVMYVAIAYLALWVGVNREYL